MYPIGATFLIMNPYIRMAADGKPMIRIDDPRSLVAVDNGEVDGKMCRYCGDMGAKFSCARCLSAVYCSKECQTDDWKLLDHKLVCVMKKQ